MKKLFQILLTLHLIVLTAPANASDCKSFSNLDTEIDMCSCLHEGSVSRINSTWHLCTLVEGKKVLVAQPDNFPEIRQAKLDMEQLFRQVDKLKQSLNSTLKISRVSKTSSIIEYETKLGMFRTFYGSKLPDSGTVESARTEYELLEIQSQTLLTSMVLNKTSIICTKGKTTKKVSGTNPKCPKGYKVKV